MKRLLYIVLFVFAVVGCSVLLFVAFSDKVSWRNQEQIFVSQDVSGNGVLHREMITLQNQNWYLIGNRLKDGSVRTVEDSSMLLSSVIKDTTIVLYISESICGSCINLALKNLDRIMTAIPQARVVILVSGFNLKGAYNDPILKKYKKSTFVCKGDVLVKPYAILSPFIALVDNDLHVLTGYHQPKNFDDLAPYFAKYLILMYYD